MCGIVGVIARSPVNQLIYDALLLLQHRGQDAAGIVTMQGTKCFMQNANGIVRDVFRTRNMRALPGNVGLGQVRYPTAGNAYSEEEAQRAAWKDWGLCQDEFTDNGGRPRAFYVRNGRRLVGDFVHAQPQKLRL